MIGPMTLKRLEALVQQAADRLKLLHEAHDKLAKANERLEHENKLLKEQVRQLSLSAAKNERIRLRLEKLSQKLDRLDKIT